MVTSVIVDTPMDRMVLQHVTRNVQETARKFVAEVGPIASSITVSSAIVIAVSLLKAL
jgi:hypothetical protein